VCDNCATHNIAEIRTWLSRNPRFHIHFTPTSTSWNQPGRAWFGLLTDKLIHRDVHTSANALEDESLDRYLEPDTPTVYLDQDR